MPVLRVLCAGFLGFAALSLAKPVEVCRIQDDCWWANKVVYQVITDRFNRGDGNSAPCDDLKDYCGGTFRGIIEQLDYIEGLGVDAIWISPIVANVPNGYHGYWAKSLTEINPHFGTAEDLKELMSEVHRRGLAVMVDVVANHMGQKWSDIPHIEPFNDASYYHNCDKCVQAGGGVGGLGCNGTLCDCWVYDYDNAEQELYCQLFGLPDLDQDNDFVREKLFEYARDLVWIYGFDGLRIDTVPYVSKPFWKSFDYAAQRVFDMGEVSSPHNGHVHSYVADGTLNSVINYPLYYQLLNSFLGKNESVIMEDGAENQNKQNLLGLSNMVAEQRRMYGDEKVAVLGNFAECHDVDRLPSLNDDVVLRKAMIMYVQAAEGIPLLYYGQEQDFVQANETLWGSDGRRTPLWTTGFTTDSPNGMYDFISRINLLKKRMPRNQFQDAKQEELLATEDIYIFQRGQAVVALTNAGSGGGKLVGSVSTRRLTPGSVVCNIYEPHEDCLTVAADGSLSITLVDGESKLYAPQIYMVGEHAWWHWMPLNHTVLLVVSVLGISAACFAVLVMRCVWTRRSEIVKSDSSAKEEDTSSDGV